MPIDPLGAIDRDTPWGERDYTLFFACLHTGRWTNELTALRYGDIWKDEQGAWYRWQPRRPKGSPARTARLDEETWEQMQALLRKSGGLEHIRPEDYVFTPLTDAGGRLEKRLGEDWQNRPLGVNTIERALRTYARWAGVDEAAATPSALRFTAARMRLEAGDSLEQLSEFLGNSCLDVTRAVARSLMASEEQARIRRRQLKTAGAAGAAGQAQEAPRRQKRGAQPGNLNALKYDWGYIEGAPSEGELLEALTSDGLEDEIAALRVMARRIWEKSEEADSPLGEIRMMVKSADTMMRVAKLVKLQYDMGKLETGLSPEWQELNRRVEEADRQAAEKGDAQEL